MEYNYQTLRQTVEKYNIYDLERINKAYEYAERLHSGQKRQTGEPYIIHPIAVACYVAEMQLDTDSVCAALLHDTVEDCGIDCSVIKKEFGQSVADIVDGLTKLQHIRFETKQDESIENLRKMFLAMSKDLRVIFVKLADRLHNMRTLYAQPPEKQRRIALETMHVYAPIAHRLGIQRIKVELETLALQYLDPVGYEQVKKDTERRFGENKNFLEHATEQVEKGLKEYGVKYTLEGRVKSIYSIYKKMFSSNKRFDEIYDFYALRILVDSEIDCYTVLGIIHECFNNIPGRFKDYISTPKPNLYRSLHTTVMSKEGVPFEVQIRTWEMHAVAEYGLAAHWKYKSGQSAGVDVDEKLRWIRTLLETDHEQDDPEEFFRPLKIDLFDDEVFVFTPRGDVISLPSGSTPIDFAYSIHSVVGNRMIGAKVNGNIVPIDTELENGQIVEIITSSVSKGPSRDWLKIVRSAEARNKIRQFFKKEMRAENIAEGKLQVERELKRFGRAFSEAQKDEIVKNTAERMGFTDPDDLYNNIGYGGIGISKVAIRLREEFNTVVAPAEEPAPVSSETLVEQTARHARKGKSNTGSVIIDNVDGCTVKFAKCCNPLPGDQIIGFITKGYGVSIHKFDCPNAVNGMSDPEQKDRWVVASWSKRIAENIFGSYEATLVVYASYAPSLIADVSLAVTDMKVAVTGISTREKDGEMVLTITVKCSGVDHLKNIITGLSRVKNVREVERL